MRKKYLSDQYGCDAAFWERNWDDPFPASPIVDAKLVSRMERYLEPGARILEGGCGNANYLRYFHEKGYRITGVDFAADTVTRIKKAFPALDVTQGDILSFSCSDGTFDAYYSGGVIEHFEAGVDGPLREAARVLKKGGLFFVTVPHMNAARRISAMALREKYIIDLDDRAAFLKEQVREFGIDTPPEGYHFHEYEFETGEMRTFLAKHGFTIVEEVPFSSLWGVMDLQPYRMLAGSGKSRANLFNKAVRRAVRTMEYIDSRQGAVLSFLSAVQSRLFGNLKLYVCISTGQRDQR